MEFPLRSDSRFRDINRNLLCIFRTESRTLFKGFAPCWVYRLRVRECHRRNKFSNDSFISRSTNGGEEESI
jgi:hypothetical protein